jgi:hypothetical protein
MDKKEEDQDFSFHYLDPMLLEVRMTTSSSMMMTMIMVVMVALCH